MKLVFKIFTTATILCGCFFMYASPLIIRGADGTYLPSVAIGWQERSGGIVLKIHESVDVNKLQQKLSGIFKELNVEKLGETIFFSSISLESFLALTADVDAGVDIKIDPLSQLKENKTSQARILEKTGEKDVSLEPKNKIITAVVRTVEFDGLNLMARIAVTIKERAKKGRSRWISGNKTIKVFFDKDQHGKILKSNRNKKLSDLMILKKNSTIRFIVDKRDLDGAYVVSKIDVRKF